MFSPEQQQAMIELANRKRYVPVGEPEVTTFDIPHTHQAFAKVLGSLAVMLFSCGLITGIPWMFNMGALFLGAAPVWYYYLGSLERKDFFRRAQKVINTSGECKELAKSLEAKPRPNRKAASGVEFVQQRNGVAFIGATRTEGHTFFLTRQRIKPEQLMWKKNFQKALDI